MLSVDPYCFYLLLKKRLYLSKTSLMNWIIQARSLLQCSGAFCIHSIMQIISFFLIYMYIHLICLQRRGAQLVVLEGKRRNVWENTWSNSCLDLHLMSSGAARAMVHAWLLSIRTIVFEGNELPKWLRYVLFCLFKID